MKRLLFTLLMLLAPACFAQGVRVSPPAITEQGTIATVTNAVIIPAAPVVKFCNSPANAVPCSNLATTYTDASLGTSCPTSTQIVLDGTTNCVSSPDAQNNWGVWVATGNYTYTVTIPGYGNFGPYYVTAGVPTSSTAAAHTYYGNSTGSTALPSFNVWPGSDTQLFFNDGGALGANSDLTYDKVTGKLNIAFTGGASAPCYIIGPPATGSIICDASGLTINSETNASIFLGSRSGSQSYEFGNCTSGCSLAAGQLFGGVMFFGGGSSPSRLFLNDGTSSAGSRQGPFFAGYKVPFVAITACGSTLEGSTQPATDSMSNTWGATYTGGGSDHVLLYCDGTNWTVMAK